MTFDEHFHALINQWYDPLYRFAFSLTRNEDESKDLTQNAFLKLARQGHKLREPARAKTWLFSVVHNEFLDIIRHRQRYPSAELVEQSLPSVSSKNDNNSGQTLDAKMVWTALDQLDERFRVPLVLFYLNEHSYREIAEMLNLPIGTIMSRLRRAKDQLRELLESNTEKKSNITNFQKGA